MQVRHNSSTPSWLPPQLTPSSASVDYSRPRPDSHTFRFNAVRPGQNSLIYPLKTDKCEDIVEFLRIQWKIPPNCSAKLFYADTCLYELKVINGTCTEEGSKTFGELLICLKDKARDGNLVLAFDSRQNAFHSQQGNSSQSSPFSSAAIPSTAAIDYSRMEGARNTLLGKVCTTPAAPRADA